MKIELEDVYKYSQPVRLIDIFALGPFMIWFGYKAKDVPTLAKGLMVGAGVATIVFNLQHYLLYERVKKAV